jgi:hypothetical protein
MNRGRDVLLQALPPLILVGVGLLLFGSSGRDDAHITYWAAHALARFGEVLNYNGVHLEQSSSLLHVVLLAILERLSGGDPVTLGRFSSIGGGVIAVALTYRLALRLDAHAAFSAAVLTAAAPYFVYWSFGGLETTLMAAAVLLFILTSGHYLDAIAPRRRDFAAMAAGMFVFALARPESPIVLVAIAAAVLLAHGVSTMAGWARSLSAGNGGARPVHFALAATGVSIALFGCRYLSFDRLFPQPVAAKASAPSLVSLRAGARYLRSQLAGGDTAVAIVAGVCAACVAYVALRHMIDRRQNPRVLLSLLFIGAYSAFIVASGGDWMEGGRFLVPLIPVVIVTVSLAAGRLLGSTTLRSLFAVALLTLQLLACVTFAARQSTGMPLWSHAAIPDGYDSGRFSWFERRNRVNLRDIPTVAHLNQVVGAVAKSRPGRVHILTGQMGMIAYHVNREWFGRVEWLDRFSLTDTTLTSCRITALLPRSYYGILVSYDFYFAHERELQSACGITPPDIVFDLGTNLMEAVLAHDFTLVYDQRGFVSSGARVLRGGTVPAVQFIAVRNHLMPAVDFRGPVVVAFGEGRLRKN